MNVANPGYWSDNYSYRFFSRTSHLGSILIKFWSCTSMSWLRQGQFMSASASESRRFINWIGKRDSNESGIANTVLGNTFDNILTVLLIFISIARNYYTFYPMPRYRAVVKENQVALLSKTHTARSRFI